MYQLVLVLPHVTRQQYYMYEESTNHISLKIIMLLTQIS